MKVLNLCCGAGHAFEGWFASEADYLAQCEKGQLDCPMCGNADVSRVTIALTAMRIDGYAIIGRA